MAVAREQASRIELIMRLRGEGVTDAAVLAAIERVPRGLFVPRALNFFAQGVRTLPIGAHETISDPSVVGRMTQALQLEPSSRVLEIGTGSGYQAAVLAHLCRQVHSVERNARLLYRAGEALEKLGLDHVQLHSGDGALGWPAHAPYTHILVTAACEDVPPALWDQLAEGGRIVLPIARDGADRGRNLTDVMVWTRRNGQVAETRRIMEAAFVPMREGFTST